MRGGQPKKRTVEECPVIDAGSLARECLQAGFEMKCVGDTPSIVIGLRYAVLTNGQEENIDTQIRLHATRPIVGGLRWWFACPIESEGRPCNRRVAKLYLPPRASYFGCRHCYELTYRSVREHDKRVDFYRKNPDDLLAALNRPNVKLSTLILALKATR